MLGNNFLKPRLGLAQFLLKCISMLQAFYLRCHGLTPLQVFSLPFMLSFEKWHSKQINHRIFDYECVMMLFILLWSFSFESITKSSSLRADIKQRTGGVNQLHGHTRYDTVETVSLCSCCCSPHHKDYSAFCLQKENTFMGF